MRQRAPCFHFIASRQTRPDFPSSTDQPHRHSADLVPPVHAFQLPPSNMYQWMLEICISCEAIRVLHIDVEYLTLGIRIDLFYVQRQHQLPQLLFTFLGRRLQ